MYIHGVKIKYLISDAKLPEKGFRNEMRKPHYHLKISCKNSTFHGRYFSCFSSKVAKRITLSYFFPTFKCSESSQTNNKFSALCVR